MEVINNATFDEFETILKRLIEQFKDKEYSKNTDLIFDQINSFHERKKAIENDERAIKSHTRPLRLGFVGGFSTGKSSMINSLLGEEVLEVKLEPATAQITELSYGEKFEIIEVTEDEDYFYYEDLSLAEYQKRSTIRKNKNKNLSHYIIKHPSKNLSRFTIVDTPGFFSTSTQDDELTKEWVKTLDLLIWIFDGDKGATKSDYDKLKRLGGNTKVIGVINKIDLKSPSVREKIRNEILKEQSFADVLFYSSKKVLEEYAKNKSFDHTLGNITSLIKDSVNSSEDFEIINVNSEIIFKTSAIAKPFSLELLKKTSYTEYYDVLIHKINNIRDNEINQILNKKLVIEHDHFRNSIKDKLLEYQNFFNGEVNICTKKIKETTILLEQSESIYNDLVEDLDTKIAASFKVFHTSFFDNLGDFLFPKYIDTGFFSDDLYICMIDVGDVQVKGKLNGLISSRFHYFLKCSFDIYAKVINESVYKNFSSIDDIRNDEHHIIFTVVDGLINSSIDAIFGYHYIFVDYKTENFFADRSFHKKNINLLVPDELLNGLIRKVLIADLIEASVNYDSSLTDIIQEQESEKNNSVETLEMIEKLIRKIN